MVYFCFYRDGVREEWIDSPEGRLEWIPDEKKLNLKLGESNHIFMPCLREGKFFSAKLEYEGDKMRTYHVVFHFSSQPFVAEKGELSVFGVIAVESVWKTLR